MDLVALKAEIAKSDYDNLTDQQIADTLNAKTVTVSSPIPNIQVKRHAILNGYWATVAIASETTNSNLQVRALAMSTKAWIEDPDATTDTTLPQVQAMLAGLVQSMLMTQQQADSLLSLSHKTLQWVEHVLGVPKVGPHHIAEARNG